MERIGHLVVSACTGRPNVRPYTRFIRACAQEGFTMTNRWRAMACGLGLVGLCGCQSTVSINNGSDAWLDVRYYVANPPDEEGGTWNFVAIGRQQIKPESTTA